MSKKKMNTKKGGNVGKKRTRAPRSARSAAGDALAPYLRMLADPCKGALVAAPYAGMGSSYVVRTVSVLDFSLGAPGTSADLVLEWTPWNSPTSVVYGVGVAGAGLTLTSLTMNSFVNGPVVKSYRPIAGCMKWIPSGPVSGRAGIVGNSYTPARTFDPPGFVSSASNHLAGAMDTAPNGSKSHEMLWLPGFEDERFGSNAEANVTGAGSCQLVLKGVDCAPATGALLGFLEFTTVWEWEALVGHASGVTANVRSPSGITLNDVLSRIKDVGRFVGGMADVGNTISSAYNYAVGANGRRQASFLTM